MFRRALRRMQFTTLVSRPAPPFREDALMPNKSFSTLSLNDLKRKYAVLFFYPLDFTFVCPTEINDLSDRIDEFEALECDVVGVSVDSKFSHLAWSERPRAEGGIQGLRFPLIADLRKQMSEAYGVLLPNEGISLRGLFVLDKAHMIRHCTVNDKPIGRSSEEVLRVVRATKHVDEHQGEACPVNWTTGKAAIDTSNSKSFFALTNPIGK